MSAREELERDALRAAQDEAAHAADKIRDQGFALGPVELIRVGEGDHYESELRLYIYRDGQLCDALEVLVWRHGAPAVSMDELIRWFRGALHGLNLLAAGLGAKARLRRVRQRH